MCVHAGPKNTVDITFWAFVHSDLFSDRKTELGVIEYSPLLVTTTPLTT